jgi:predicted dehydrogenase
MIRVGVVGIGFMGKMHFGVHQASGKSRVVAIADVNEAKLRGDWSAIAGNIDDPSAKQVNLAGIKTYAKVEDLIHDPAVDLVDITLPTYLHARYAVAALKAGKHVLCEKPIALTMEQANVMVAAAKKARGHFMVAQCIRFWPEYEVAKELVEKKTYGAVYSASFRRVSATPVWGWRNWLQKHRLSGGAVIDLHIHDIDYINYLFGVPKAVSAAGITKTSGGVDHIVCNYTFGRKNLQVSAEGGWGMHPAFPFSMAFTIVCAQATIDYSSAKSPALTVFTSDGKAVVPEVPAGHGYSREIDYFLTCVQEGRKPTRVTAEGARDALRVAWAEIRSVESGRRVALR